VTGRQLKARLKEAGVSQRKLAFWLGYDVGTVNGWVLGRYGAKVPRHIEVIADLLVKFPEIRPNQPSSWYAK
jgi:hypothetical protein